MKLLKRVLILLVVVLVVGLLYVVMQPSDYDVKRSHIIKAPLATVFNTVNDLKTWEKWGPWHDEDSTIVVTYGEKTIGVGANDSWTSKQGPGKMKTVAVEENKSIHQVLQFGDYEPTDIYWEFKETETGTEITWRMQESKAPFFFKLFAAFSGGWDAMFGEMEAKGLENLDNVILKELKMNPPFKLGEITQVDLTEKRFIGFYHKIKIDHDEMTKLFMQDMPKVGMYAAKSGLKPGEYTPGSVYTMYDEKAGMTEFYIGLLLHKKIKPGKGMIAVTLDKGKAVTISKFGNYGTGDYEAHMAIDAHLKVNQLTMKFPIWELYVNDPTTVKPSEIQTDIYYPLK
jgi:effector-binding domain-containing protein